MLEETIHPATTGSSFRAKHITNIRKKFPLRLCSLFEHLRYLVLEQLHCVIGMAAIAVATRGGVCFSVCPALVAARVL
jgi:hypothetical protein